MCENLFLEQDNCKMDFVMDYVDGGEGGRGAVTGKQKDKTLFFNSD